MREKAPFNQSERRVESLTVGVSPSSRQSGELVRKTQQLGLRIKGDRANEISIASRITGLPGKEATVREVSEVSLLLVREAAPGERVFGGISGGGADDDRGSAVSAGISLRVCAVDYRGS